MTDTISKQLAEKAGYVPRLILGEKIEGGGVESTGPHVVTFIRDRIVKGVDYHTNEEREEVEYIFEERGEQKHYNAPIKNKAGKLHYFVARISEFPYGIKLVLEMKNRGAKNYIDVKTVQNREEIPVVEEEDE